MLSIDVCIGEGLNLLNTSCNKFSTLEKSFVPEVHRLENPILIGFSQLALYYVF